jgi:uncharacterized protein YoxC
MIATWQLITVVLLAVLVGAAVPALLQLRRTLRSAEIVLESTGPKVDRTLEEVSEAAARINRLGKSLERDSEGLQVFTDAAAGLGRSLKQAQASLRIMTTVGAAVGPAIAAGLRALFAREDEAASRPVEEDESAKADARPAGAPAEDQATRVDHAARVGHE